MLVSTKQYLFVCFSVCEIRWVYLIKGVTETAAGKDLAPAIVHTQARQRTEMRLEVMLSNSVAGAKQLMRCRPISDDENDGKPQQIIVGEGEYCHVFALQ